jgi:TonB-linked SusC/RagA family outer membrane protein
MAQYDKLLKGWLFSLFMLLFAAAGAQAQQITVHGTVKDAQTGEAMSGVNILIVGTSTGTATNKEGQYSINTPSNGTLRFSFIGYTTKTIKISGRTTVNVTLKSKVLSGEQMVVVGYQTKKKNEITGSVSTISGSDIENIPVANIGKSLQGRLPGLKVVNHGGLPGLGEPKIRVRGKGTLGNNTPLVIVDGVPQPGFQYLSSNNIANISVLTGASAAIYGSRAANGVILVTTKKGRKGSPQITLNSSFGLQTFAGRQHLESSWQYATWQDEVAERYGTSKQFSKEDIQKYKSGKFPKTYPNTDWWDVTFQKSAPQTSHSLSISGGGDNIQYYVGGKYLYQQSMFAGGHKYAKRYLIRSNINYQVTDRLNMDLNLMGRLRHYDFPRSVYIYSLAQSKPTDVGFYPNGLAGGGVANINMAVLASDSAGNKTRIKRTFRPRLTVNLDIAKGLSLVGVAAYDFNVPSQTNIGKTYSVWNYDRNTDTYSPTPGISGSVSSVHRGVTFTKQTYYNLRLKYKKSFGPNNINAFIAYEQQTETGSNFGGTRHNLISNSKPQLWASSTTNQTISGTRHDQIGRLSYFGSVSYNYKTKYLLNFTLRRDGSSFFAEGHRFGTFPSVSAGWILTEEPFMSSTSNWLDNLKLRVAWSKTGNDRVKAYQYLAKYALNTYTIFGVSNATRFNGFQQTNVPNPNITWETSKEWDIGLNAALLDNALALKFTYFLEKRRGILIQRNQSVPLFTGLNLPDENLGKVNNHGFELKANYQNTVGNIQYRIGGNVQFSKNKIVYMDEAPNIPDYQKKTGHPIDSYVVYKTDGIFHNQEEVDNTKVKLDGTLPGDIKYIDINGDGEINGNDQYRAYKSELPPMQYGITLGMNYKGLGFQAFFQGQAGGAVPFSANNRVTMPDYLFAKRWTPNHKDASFPRAYGTNDIYNGNTSKPSDFWLYPTNFIALKDLRISYTLPVRLVKKLEKLQIYVEGTNLWNYNLITKRTGYKIWPDLGAQSGSQASGRGYSGQNPGAYYSQLRTFSVGLNVTF